MNIKPKYTKKKQVKQNMTKKYHNTIDPILPKLTNLKRWVAAVAVACQMWPK